MKLTFTFSLVVYWVTFLHRFVTNSFR